VTLNAKVAGAWVEPEDLYAHEAGGWKLAKYAYGNQGGTWTETYRINPTDPNFRDSVFSGNVVAVAAQPDGKIIVGGDITAYKGVACHGVVRLNVDGSLDTVFSDNLGPTIGFNTISPGSSGRITLQPDGKILIAGGFTTWDGRPRDGLIRLNSDGSEDTTFTANSNIANNCFAGAVRGTVLQSDNKILVYGIFTSYTDTSSTQRSFSIIRLNADGTFDSSFPNVPAQDKLISFVGQIAVRDDDKIVVVGGFSSILNVPINKIALLNADGSFNYDFKTAIGTGFSYNFNVEPVGVSIQPDGKIIVSGKMVSFNGVSIARVTRLSQDGYLDSDFNDNVKNIPVLNDANYFYWESLVQSSGKIVLMTPYSNTDFIRLDSEGNRDDYNFNDLFAAGRHSQAAETLDGRLALIGNFVVTKAI
jgi:uncharacterized delta-60 repeat protein